MKPIIINITDEGVHIPMELLKTNGFAQVLVVNKSSLVPTIEPTNPATLAPIMRHTPTPSPTTTPEVPCDYSPTLTPAVENKPKRKRKTTTPELVSTPMPATTPEPTQSTLKKVVNEYLGKKK